MHSKTLSKILLIDNEQDILKLATIALKDIGQLKVKCCNSGKEAVQEVEAYDPDLILLDVIMPEMDGIHTLKAIRKLKTQKKTPIIFLTALTEAGDIDYYRKLGALAVITKPFNPQTLAETLKTLWVQKHNE